MIVFPSCLHTAAVHYGSDLWPQLQRAEACHHMVQTGWQSVRIKPEGVTVGWWDPRGLNIAVNTTHTFTAQRRRADEERCTDPSIWSILTVVNTIISLWSIHHKYWRQDDETWNHRLISSCLSLVSVNGARVNEIKHTHMCAFVWKPTGGCWLLLTSHERSALMGRGCPVLTQPAS